MNELAKMACELPIYQRRELVQRINQSIVKEKQVVSAQDRYELVKSTVELVMDHKIESGRFHRDVLCRMYIAYILVQDGYKVETIGKLLGRHHSTIIYLKKMMQDMLSLPSIYQDEVTKLNQIKALLQDGERGTEDD